MNLEKRKSIFVVALILFVALASAGIFVYEGYRKSLDAFAKEKSLPIHSINTEEKNIALTFDINWAEKDYLSDILNIMDKYNVKGTFFMMGKWIDCTEENAEKLKLIQEKGHEIGNHSYIHPNFSEISGDKIEKEIKKTEETIKKVTGEETKLFRFPSGDYNDAAVKKVIELGYIPIQWDADSVDWRQDGEKQEYERVRKKVKPGSITLFHNNAKYTPKNLDRIIKELKDEGYEFKKVGEMIYKEDYYIDSNGVQHKK